MGVTLKPDDISISHRLPARAGECRPMIVKFVRRTTKINMMRNKRALRENPTPKKTRSLCQRRSYAAAGKVSARNETGH